MSRKPLSAKPLSNVDRPESGPVALLRAIGLSAVQVSPGVVALQANPKKRAA